MKPRTARLAGLLSIAWLGAAAAIAESAPPADLDAWVARSMKTFDVPGMAVAIVKDGKVAVARGYGVRKLGEPAPVDAHTLFGIASNTKAFTAAALAILVDEGKLAWDDPVQKHLPAFQLYDPYVSRELTVRDLLCHRSGLGLGAGDLLFWPDTDVTRDQVVSAARYIRPASSLRSRYAYNNLMFVVAGQVVAAVSGKSWDDFVRERIFGPLGMGETRIGSAGLTGMAAPHSRGWRLDGTLTPVASTRDQTWAAAAGIRTNVTDLPKWVLAQLRRGALEGGGRLFSEAAGREMWSPQIPLRLPEPPAPLRALAPNFAAYGLGWSLRDYQGRKVVSHGGALTGMVSTVYLVPEENLGIVVLTNQEETGAYSSVVYHVVDHYLRLPATDWIAAFRAARDETVRKAAEAEAQQAAGRAPASKASLELQRYAGQYTDTWYGKADIRLEDNRLVLSMSRTPAMVGDISHWQYDTFLVRWRDKTIPDAFLTFSLDRHGAVAEAKMAATSPLADFSFDYQDLLLKPHRGEGK